MFRWGDASWQAVWDREFLYLFVTVSDSVAIMDGPNPWDDDSVEIYIDANNNHGGTYDGLNDVQYLFLRQALDNTPPVLGGSSTYARVDGILSATRETPGGYTYEVAIPWGTLEVEPLAGEDVAPGNEDKGPAIGIDVHINDDGDGGQREGRRAWALDSRSQDLSYLQPELFGRAVLQLDN